MRVVCEGRVRTRRNALVRLTTSTRVSIFLAQARVPGGDRGARPISLLTMKCIVIHTCQLPFLSQNAEERRVRPLDAGSSRSRVLRFWSLFFINAFVSGPFFLTIFSC